MTTSPKNSAFLETPERAESSGQFPSSFWSLLARFLLQTANDPDVVQEKVFAESHAALWGGFLAKLLPDWKTFSFPEITFRGWWSDVLPAYRHLQPASVEFEWKKLGLRLKQTWLPLFPKEGDYNVFAPESDLEIWHEHKTTNLLGYVRGSKAISDLLHSLNEKSPCPAQLKREYDVLSNISLGSLDAFQGISCEVFLKRPFVPKYFFKPPKEPSQAAAKPAPPFSPALPRWLICKAGDSPEKAVTQGREAAFPEREILRVCLLTEEITIIFLKNGEKWYTATPFVSCLSRLGLTDLGL